MCNCSNPYRPSGLNYIVYNNRCVKAKLEDTYCDAYKALRSIISKLHKPFQQFPQEEMITDFTWSLLNFQGIKSSYTGKATVNLSDGDTFEEETGKSLAKKRVLDAYHKDFDSSMCYALENLRTICAGLEHYCTKHNIDFSEVPQVEQIENKIYNSGYKANKVKPEV